MLKPVPFANAAAIVAASVYVLCRVLVAIMPNVLFGMMQTWVHTVNLESLQLDESLSFGTFLGGLISLVVLVWLLVYATIALYNRLANGK